MEQINEVKRMQELAGLTKEAPTMPPVPSNKPKLPPVPGKTPVKSNLSDSLKEKYINQAYDVISSTATYKKYNILNSNEIKALEDILDKVMTGFQNLK